MGAIFVASFSDIISAVDQTIEDGVDVICMFIGGDDLPLENNAIAIASFSAVLLE